MRPGILKSNRGWAMPLALIIVMVSALLSTALFFYATSDILHVKKETDAEKARYLARSGAEAVIRAWKDSAADARLSGEVETIYQLADGSYKNALTLQPSDKIIGKVDVKVTNNADKSAKFEAVANVNGTVKKVTVTSTPYTYGHDLNPKWYDKATGVTVQPVAHSQTETVNGNTYTLMYSDPSGVVIWDADNDIELPSRTQSFWFFDLTVPDNSRNKVGYVAQAMYFRDSLNLARYYDTLNNAGVLVTSAQTLVFENDVRLYYGLTSVSTLVLHVPRQLGIKLQGKSGLYGKAYFKNGVTLVGPVYGTSTIIPAGAYYFRLKEVDGKETGINLIDWALWKNPGWTGNIYNYTEDDFFPMSSINGSDDINKAVPDPEDNVAFVWDW